MVEDGRQFHQLGALVERRSGWAVRRFPAAKPSLAAAPAIARANQIRAERCRPTPRPASRSRSPIGRSQARQA